MKKIITLLFSFILLASLTACSESAEKLYGFYKDVDEKTNVLGYITTITISEKGFNFTSPGSNFPTLLPPKKDGELWILTAPNPETNQYVMKIREVAPNTIKCFNDYNGEENPIGTFIKITEEEFKHIQETPKIPTKKIPSLF